MQYRLDNGRLMTLTSYDKREWAEMMRAALRHLGCSDEYAQAEFHRIAAAKPL